MKKHTPEAKLKELIVYIATKCSEDPKFGETKLNKILFYSDFLYYLRNLKPVTGHQYVHLPYGPIPNNMKAVLKQMGGKDIAFAVSNAGPYKRNRIVALRDANLSMFDADMISLVDSVIDTVCGENTWTANQLSDSTHETMGWLVTKNGDSIPYQTIFVKNKQFQVPTEIERIRAKQIAQELGGNYGFATSNT